MGEYITGLVSVIMPTYKRSEKLIRAIDSVLNQSYKSIELILVNDNEPDDEYTSELLKRIKLYERDERFLLVIQDKHINGAVARNVGIKKARGEYVAFLDDDDWWDENKLKVQIEELNKMDCSFGVVSCKIIQCKDEKIISYLPRFDDGYVYKDVLLLKSDFATGTLLFRHDYLDKTGYFDEQLLRHQDLQLLVNFTYKYKLVQVDQYLHYCDVSDMQNRPNVEKIISAKKMFFKSVAPIINTLTEKEKYDIKIMHRFEIGYVQIKNHMFMKGIANCLSVFLSFKSCAIVFSKFKLKLFKSNKGDMQ